MNGIGEDVGATVMMGKVIRPLRSVDPSQTEYQGLIEVTEEGWCLVIMELIDLRGWGGEDDVNPPLFGCFRWK